VYNGVFPYLQVYLINQTKGGNQYLWGCDEIMHYLCVTNKDVKINSHDFLIVWLLLHTFSSKLHPYFSGNRCIVF
jgi:hypothetical protein